MYNKVEVPVSTKCYNKSRSVWAYCQASGLVCN